jgi:hypothetical protein
MTEWIERKKGRIKGQARGAFHAMTEGPDLQDSKKEEE